MTFVKKYLLPFLLVSAAAVPAAADTSRFTWHPFSGATVTPVAYANADGYMAGGRFHYAGETSLGDNPVYYWLAASATAGRIEAGETQLGGRADDVFGFGREITIRNQVSIEAGLRYPYHPHRQWIVTAGVLGYNINIKEDFYLFDLVRDDEASGWVTASYLKVAHQWYVASQQAMLTASLQATRGIDQNDLSFPISTGEYRYEGTTYRAELDYARATNWGMWGGHVALSNDDFGTFPEIGLRAERSFGRHSIGPVEFNVSGFVSGEVIKYDRYTDKAARLGVVLDHASGLSATVGASWNQDDKWQGIVGVEMRF